MNMVENIFTMFILIVDFTLLAIILSFVYLAFIEKEKKEKKSLNDK